LPSGIAVVDTATWADQLADAADEDRRRVLLREMLARLSSFEAKYLVKLVGGELRIGVEVAHIETALARRVRR